MNYQDYKDARDASWRILIDCKVTELPVRISGVCRALGVSVRRYTPAERDNNDGMSAVIGGAPTIMVSSLAIPARQRFLTSPLERLVYDQFADYIKGHRLPGAGR